MGLAAMSRAGAAKVPTGSPHGDPSPASTTAAATTIAEGEAFRRLG